MSDASALPLVQSGLDIVTVKAGSLDGVEGPYRIAVAPSLARMLLRLLADSVSGFACRLEGALVDGEARSFADITVDRDAVDDLTWQLVPIADGT